MRKRHILKIIYVYKQEENIPRVLWRLLSVEYTKGDFEGIVNTLIKEILRKISEELSLIT